MVDTVTGTMGNDNDDWEVAVDTGEFDKRLEQQEKDRAATQESTSSTLNDDENRNSSNINLIKSNKPIRILKRPISQPQLPVTNDIINSNTTTTTTIVSNTTITNNNHSPFSNNISSPTTVPIVSIIPRDSINSSQSSTSSSSQSTKPAIKTYEQRELEYRLARLRIMGEEESSIKDDEDTLTTESIETSNESSQSLLLDHSTPINYTVNNVLSNTGSIHFTPQTNSTGPFLQQQYHSTYSIPYPQLPLAPSLHYPTTTLYMPSSNPWYHYQQQQTTPYGTQQYSHPQ